MARIDVRQSGIWQTNSTLISARGLVLAVDPAYFPRELDELAALARGLGEVTAVAFTHGHWDHVIGWQRFPAAKVWASPTLAAAIEGDTQLARQNLAQAREFDGRWYVEREPALGWPAAARAVHDGEEVLVGDIALSALQLPGHSSDGLALIVCETGLLLPGDYLSPCEIPFVEDLPAYRATLARLDALLRESVREVVPGHGPRLTAADARAIAAADLRYLDELARHAERKDRAAALAMLLPRADGVPGMREHHIENCAAAGLL